MEAEESSNMPANGTPPVPAGPDYALDGLTVTIKDAAGTVAGLLAHPVTFADVVLYPDDGGAKTMLFATPPALSGQGGWVVGGTKLDITSSAVYKASALVGAGAADPDGVVAAAAAGRAWLKQEIDLALAFGAQGSGSFGLAGGNAVAGGTAGVAAAVRLLDYRGHAAGDDVGSALVGAIRDARFAVRAADIARLDGQDCLAFLAGGKLALSASVSMASAMSASLTALDAVLGVTGVLQIHTGATVALAVALSDAFQLIFRRAARSGWIAVDVHKASGSNVSLTASLGVDAQLANSQAVVAALDAYVEARLGIAYATLQQLELAVAAGAAELATLPPALQEAAQTVANQLRLGDLATHYTALVSRITGLGAKLQQTVAVVLAADVKAQFTFAWSRVASDETVLSFEIEDAALAGLLDGMLLGNLAPVLAELAGGSAGLTLRNYLGTEKVETGRSFGVSLSLGTWSVESKTSTDAQEQVERRIAGGKQVERRSIDGRSSFTANLFGKDVSTYFVDLSAAMADFSAQPVLTDYLLGLRLSFTWQRTPSAGLVAQWQDTAEVWGLAQAPATKVAQSGKANVEAAVNIAVTDDGVRLLAGIAQNDAARWQEAWGWALAGALPRIPGGTLRHTVADREAIYGGAARWLLDQMSRGNAVETSAVAARVAYTGAQGPLRDIDLSPNNPYTLLGFKTLWQVESLTRNPWSLCERTRQALARLALPAAGDQDVAAAVQALAFAVDGDAFSMRLLGGAIVRLLKAGGAPGPLFTADARYEFQSAMSLLATGA
jgi:hypothetical protein